MDDGRLQELLLRSAHARVLVVGDFALNQRMLIDPARTEYAEETGLRAHQVVGVDVAPGAAGRIAAALRAFGVAVTALGVIGDDGEGYELRRHLRKDGIDERPMIVVPGRYTPTSIQPVMASGASALYEQERLDIRSRDPLAASAITMVIKRLRALATQVHAVVIADHIPEEECGVITRRLRLEIANLSLRHQDVRFLATSRYRIGLFRHVMLLSSARECVRAVYADDSSNPPLALVGQAAEQLRRRTGKPVIVSLGARGMLVVHDQGMTHAPAIPVTGPVNLISARDSAVAAVTAALCAGATLDEAAELGSLALATAMHCTNADAASPDRIIALWRASRTPTRDE